MKEKQQRAKHKVPADVERVFIEILKVWHQYPICNINITRNYRTVGFSFTPKMSFDIGDIDAVEFESETVKQKA